MTATRIRAALVGGGRAGAGYADDPATARHFRYATHAQVLAEHPALEWSLVVDRSEDVRDRVASQWGVAHTADAAGIARGGIELVAIATPPDGRLDLVRSLGDVKAIVLEKPIASTLEEARALVDHCEARGIVLQVALWRRADPRMRALAEGELHATIGDTLAAFGLYGNGMRNNGTHLVDLARMLIGEVASVQALGAPERAGPLAGDVDVPFALHFEGGPLGVFQPIPVGAYREVALDIWGEHGRLEILQEGLRCVRYPVTQHRAMTGEREVASDDPTELGTGAGEALYGLYDNVVSALRAGAELWSPGRSALRSEAVVDAVLSAPLIGTTALPT